MHIINVMNWLSYRNLVRMSAADVLHIFDSSRYKLKKPNETCDYRSLIINREKIVFEECVAILHKIEID